MGSTNHPHLHLLATSGGYDDQGERWEHINYLPYELLRRKWQWHLLRMVRQTLTTEAVNELVEACFTKYPNGLVTNVQKGQVPWQYQSVARYVAKYVVSPPISVRRIDHYDGHQVIYHYRSHRTERTERERVDVDTFIGRMIQHTMPKGFQRIRYYGVQATKTFAKVKRLIQAALAKVERMVKGTVKIIARLTYRQRYEQSTGRDPLRCPHCRREMGLWRIWHPTYEVIYDEGQVIKRGTYASSAQRAGPEAMGDVLKSPPGGRYVPFRAALRTSRRLAAWRTSTFFDVPPGSWTPALLVHMTSPEVSSRRMKLPKRPCKHARCFL